MEIPPYMKECSLVTAGITIRSDIILIWNDDNISHPTWKVHVIPTPVRKMKYKKIRLYPIILLFPLILLSLKNLEQYIKKCATVIIYIRKYDTPDRHRQESIIGDDSIVFSLWHMFELVQPPCVSCLIRMYLSRCLSKW